LVKVRNVVGQTKTGDAHNVVVAGAHLGSAATQPGHERRRFGCRRSVGDRRATGWLANRDQWGPVRLLGFRRVRCRGPTKYVSGLDRENIADIAVYLNFDMLASKNAGYFTYDGDQSGQPSPGIPTASVPPGSAGAGTHPCGLPEPGRCAACRHAVEPGQRLRPVPDSRHTDRRHHHRRLTAEVRGAGEALGRPGGASRSTSATARRATNVDNVNPQALAITGPAVGFAVGTYAASTDGPNGFKPRG